MMMMTTFLCYGVQQILVQDFGSQRSSQLLMPYLQAIYITVNCTFTRPVLDLIYQWREEKLDYYKQEHNLYTTNHILSTHNQNEKNKNSAHEFKQIPNYYLYFCIPIISNNSSLPMLVVLIVYQQTDY
ncbi:unnamed protein product [Heterobilharzia americana]|nr:unnamed protein product [Heterobilharzia americana]